MSDTKHLKSETEGKTLSQISTEACPVICDMFFGSVTGYLRQVMQARSANVADGNGNRSRRRLGWRVAPTAGPELVRETAEFYAAI